MTKKEKTTQATDQKYPPLYNKLVPLNPEIHKNLKMHTNLDFSFAKNINAVPVVLQEMASVAKHYPIVFAGDGSGALLAVLGLKADENLFVDDEGNWKEDSYIPAYVRRYPFFIAKSDNVPGPIMCVDDSSSIFSEDGDRVLIKDGKVMDDMKTIAETANSIQNYLEQTALYGQGIAKKGLLESQTVGLKLENEVQAQVDGFKTVNREKFDAVDGKTLKNWLNKDWLDATILHLASGENFNRLWQMKLKQDGKK